MTIRLCAKPRWWNAALLVAAFALTGCGGPKLASVTGSVTYNGDPVKGGTLIFGPIGAGQIVPGKAATATVQPDGSFTLGTNRVADGAIVGKHQVRYTPPVQEMTEEQRRDPKYIAPLPLYMGMKPKEMEVEIKPGANTIRVELVPGR